MKFKVLVEKECIVHSDTFHYLIDDVLLRYKCIACEESSEQVNVVRMLENIYE